jgi:hypothetical protein
MNKKKKINKPLTDLTKTSIIIPTIWHKKIKLKCIEQNKKMVEEIKNALQQYFNL